MVRIDFNRCFQDDKQYEDFYSTSLLESLSICNPLTDLKLKIQSLLEKNYSKNEIALDLNILF